MILTRTQKELVAGDVVLLAILTLVGFAFHKEVSAVSRMATTFVPLLAAWLVTAPWFGLFDETVVLSPGRVWWRTAWAWVLTGALGTLLRAIWLNSVVLPIFALVLTGLHILFFVLWRTGYAWARSRSPRWRAHHA